MRFYPDIPSRRAATIARDATLLLLLVLLAWLGVKVHDTVDELSVLGRGVTDAGNSVQSSFRSAADAVDGAPLIGPRLGGGLREAGAGSGGKVAEVGRKGEDSVHETAALLGWLTFLVPGGLLVAWMVPPRVAQVRRLTAASQALAGAGAGSFERRRLLAMRAAFSLPYAQLLAHTRDPLGDLEHERYDALVAAALDDAGLRRPPAG